MPPTPPTFGAPRGTRGAPLSYVVSLAQGGGATTLRGGEVGIGGTAITLQQRDRFVIERQRPRGIVLGIRDVDEHRALRP